MSGILKGLARSLWGGVAGTLADQADLQAALNAKAAYNAPITLGASTTLNAAQHANRLIISTAATDISLTLQTDGAGGFSGDDAIFVYREGAGQVTFVAGGAALENTSGMLVATIAGRPFVSVQRVRANTWAPTEAAGSGSVVYDKLSDLGNVASIFPDRVQSTLFSGRGILPDFPNGTVTARAYTNTVFGRFSRFGVVAAAGADSSAAGGGAANINGRNLYLAPDSIWQFTLVAGVADAAALGAFAMGIGHADSAAPVRTTNDFQLWRLLLAANEGTDQLVIAHGDPADGAMVTVALNGGAGFPARSNSVSLYRLYARHFPASGPGGRRIEWEVKNITTGLIVGGTITTRLPNDAAAVAQGAVGPQVARRSGTEAAIQVAFDFVGYQSGAGARGAY